MYPFGLVTLAGVLALSHHFVALALKKKIKNLTWEPYILHMGIISHFMNLKAVYIHLGFFQMSITNLITILCMLTIFVAALVIPFPGNRKKDKK